jgi:hypothetical protein
MCLGIVADSDFTLMMRLSLKESILSVSEPVNEIKEELEECVQQVKKHLNLV